MHACICPCVCVCVRLAHAAHRLPRCTPKDSVGRQQPTTCKKHPTVKSHPTVKRQPTVKRLTWPHSLVCRARCLTKLSTFCHVVGRRCIVRVQGPGAICRRIRGGPAQVCAGRWPLAPGPGPAQECAGWQRGQMDHAARALGHAAWTLGHAAWALAHVCTVWRPGAAWSRRCAACLSATAQCNSWPTEGPCTDGYGASSIGARGERRRHRRTLWDLVTHRGGAFGVMAQLISLNERALGDT